MNFDHDIHPTTQFTEFGEENKTDEEKAGQKKSNIRFLDTDNQLNITVENGNEKDWGIPEKQPPLSPHFRPWGFHKKDVTLKSDSDSNYQQSEDNSNDTYNVLHNHIQN
jgi:hypothetical protein